MKWNRSVAVSPKAAFGVLLGQVTVWVGSAALAAEQQPATVENLGPSVPAEQERSRPMFRRTKFRRTIDPSRGYQHYTLGLSLGKGVRFNNPFRLSTPLGDSAESLSLTATYLDLAVGSQWGSPDSVQHGIVGQFAYAVQGVTQEVLTPSYRALLRLPPRIWVFGRAGFPVILEPDVNVGLELGLGSVVMLTSALGVSAELVGSVFYGAATLDKARTAVELVSMQVGLWYDYEVLP